MQYLGTLDSFERSNLRSAVRDYDMSDFRVKTKTVSIEADLHISIETEVTYNTNISQSDFLDPAIERALVKEMAERVRDHDSGQYIEFTNVKIVDVNGQEEDNGQTQD